MLALLRSPLLAGRRAATRSFSASARASDVLLFVEHKGGAVNAASLSALTAARKLGAGDVHALVGGKEADVQGIADKVAKFDGVSKVLHASGEALGSSLAEAFAPLLKQVASSGSYTHVVAGHTALGRDVVPRAAALLDASQISDIIAVHDADTFERPIYAGNAIAKVKSADKLKVLTVRGTAFDKAATEGGSASAEKVDFAEPSISTRLVSEQISKSSRPELATAARVVSGGRALKSAEGFEKYIEPLADALNAAVGASRAAVDAGYAANNLQVGQTGVVVAPELYLAVGISGAIQHLAGMKEAKTIVSINKDPECPMAEIADFALVANLEDAVPELLEKLKSA